MIIKTIGLLLAVIILAYAGTAEAIQCFDNRDCDLGFYCEKPFGRCDSAGDCIKRPDACITLYDPVCGCDGATYGNACDAAMFGASVAYRGVCLLGDINKDGFVDISDVILELRRALCISCPPPPCSDINNDGIVDISDVILTLRMALGIDPLQPCTG